MDDDENAVIITHFINPYQFWYCSVDEASYIDVRDIEEELNSYLKHNNGRMLRSSDIKQGSVIAVKYLPRNLFIRVRVEDIERNQRNAVSYIVWAIDHGFPFKTSGEFCRRLPDLPNFNKKIDRVRCGGIEKIVPASLEYSFLEQKQVTVLTDKWCLRACESLNKIITDAASIEFLGRFNKDGQYWGDLVICNHRGNVQHASDYLINQQVAVRNVEKFKKCFLIPKRYIIPTWQTNDGKNNYKENIAATLDLLDFSVNERICNLNDSHFQSAQIKVAAWDNFNKNAARNVRTNRSLVETPGSTSVLYDDVDDSVSKVDLKLNAKKNLNYSMKKVPPKPTLNDFGITENEVATKDFASTLNEETCSNITQRTRGHGRSQYLRIMREKYLLEKNPSVLESSDTLQKEHEMNIAQAMQNKPNETSKKFEANAASTHESDDVELAKFVHPYRTGKESSFTSQQKNHALNKDSNSSKFEKLPFSECNAKVPSEKISTAASEYRKKSQYLNQLRLLKRQIDSKKTEIEKTSVYKLEASETASSLSNARIQTVVYPAGFDLSNLNKYNKQDHWHRKETTRNEYHPHFNKDLRFTRPNNDNQQNVVEKIHEKIKTSISKNPISEINTELETKTEAKDKIDSLTPTLEAKPLSKTKTKGEKKEDSDTEIYADANAEDDISHNGEEKELQNYSNASSRLSMYSAKSSSDDIPHIVEQGTLKTLKPTNTQLQNTIEENSSKDLQNFIKTFSNNNEKTNQQVSPLLIQSSTQSSVTEDTTTELSQSIPCLTGDKAMRLNLFTHTVLAHAANEVKPIESLNKVCLAPDVQNAMLSRGFNRVSRTQAYAWPHLLQGKSLFIVNPPDSCKTWCFIPTLCSAIVNGLRNESVPNTYGPLAIVLVASSDCVTTVSNYCMFLLRQLQRPDAKIVCSFGVSQLMQTKILLMEGCAILVATPPNFRRLFEDNPCKDPLFNSQRLKHIIIDDIDVMQSRCKDDITSALKSLYAFVPKVNKTKKILPQLVVTSRTYSPALEKLIPISNEPLLVIGDFLEAAVYGKAKICFEICAKAEKVQRIIEFIKDHPYKNESLIIICNHDEDVFTICEQLQLSGIDCLGCHSETSTLVRHQVHKWKLPEHIHSKVLVCTDSVLFEYEIQNVKNMIHYSLASMWTKMKFRFSVHKGTYENLIKNGFLATKPIEQPATSLILIDEENNQELPRIVEFLKSHNQMKNISPDIIKLSKRITMQREKERCRVGYEFCDLFFEYGECDKLDCKKRHMLTEDDIKTRESKDALIQSGDLRMLVLNVYSPTSFAVRLLEHRPKDTTAWRCIRQSNKAASFAMKFNFFYTNSDNLARHWPIKINDICVLERNGTFHRVRVLEVPSVKSENIIKSLDISIKFIDNGDIITEKSDYLFVCHEQFKEFPEQASIVRLIGLRPLDNETSWDADTTSYVKDLLINKIQKDETVCASVSFSLVDTIVVRNMLVMKKLPTLGKYIVTENLKRALVFKEYAVIEQNAEHRIHNIIKESGFERILSEPATTEEDKTVAVESLNLNEIGAFNVGDKNIKKIEANERAKVQIKVETKSESPNKNFAKILKPTKAKKTRTEFLRNFKEAQAAEQQSPMNSEALQKETIGTPLPKACSYLEFLQVLQRSNQLDAEDCDLDGEGMEQMRDYIKQTDMMCKLEIIRELERQNSNSKTRAIMADTAYTTDNKSYQKSNKQVDVLPASESLKETCPDVASENEEIELSNMPTLRNLHKRPQTNWYETNHLIILSISAPDIEDYHLVVEKTFLYFMTTLEGVDHVLVLNFLGTVEPQYTSHEIRGLCVIVRLVKTLFMRWPRLIKQEEKMPWLSYDLNMLNVKELEKLLPQQLIDRVLHKQDLNKYNHDIDDNVSESGLETYTRIENADDIHDPINADLL